MEKKLKMLFDYQRFEKNPHLEKLIEETESRAAQLLSDDDLFFVNAAGETELSGGAAGLGFNEKAVPFKSENP